MRYGICTESTNAPVVKQLGFDFIELGVAELAPEKLETEFASVRARVLDAGLRAEALNKFIPKGLMLVGPEVDVARARSYVEVALGRAESIGTETIVWGSPHARYVPDGFAREKALEQLAEIGRFMGEVAFRHGITIVVEPLDKATTNTIWTVADGYEMARMIDHPNVKTMADIYQMYMNDEPLAGMKVAGDHVAHVHVSDPDRLPPGNPEYFAFYEEAAAVLKEIGYDGRVSIEARMREFEGEARRGLTVVKEIFDRARTP